MERNRFLLRADVEGYAYADILEVQPNRVRLLRPSADVRRALRFALVGVVLVWAVLLAVPLQAGVAELFAWLAWPGWLALVTAGAVWWSSLLAALLWWDNRTLRVLALAAGDPTEVKVLEVTSFWTFQEVRAATDKGELRITVQGTHRKVGRVLKAAGVLAASAA